MAILLFVLALLIFDLCPDEEACEGLGGCEE
jgi:hypothetical protein